MGKQKIEIVEQMLRKKKVTQAELAERLGMSQANVSKMCNNPNVTFKRLTQVAKVLEFSYNELKALIMQHFNEQLNAKI